MNTNTQKGFTLVEIAMVLIVIALIMGGLMKASEMITNARLKKIQSAQAGLIASLNMYYDRYRQFPGDDPDATRNFTAYIGMPEVNGNGDGDVGEGDDWDLDESTPLSAGEQETLKFFGHLRAAGFIDGAPTIFTRPRHSIDGGKIGIQSGSLGLRRHVLVFSQLDGKYVNILDAWNDDNSSNTGIIRSVSVGDDMELDDTPAITIVPENRYNLVWELAGQ